MGSRLTRRHLIRSAITLAALGPLAACAPAPQPTPTPAPTPKPAEKPAQPTPTATPAPAAKPAEKPAQPTPTPAAVAKVRDVPRNRTLILRWGGREGRYIDHDLWNPYAIGANHQNGPGIFYEPLAFYSAFADKMIPWLAESWQYSPDYKQLEITLRPGITWSDGVPFSAEDVAFTLNSLRDLGPQVRWGVDVQQFVEEARAVSDRKVVVRFKVPAPRFFYFMSYKFDIGVYIVPKHIFQGQDWTKFTHFDLAKGWPVTTGPWRVVFASPDQKVIDRRDDWWAAKAGLAKLPRVERIIYLPFHGETQVAQELIRNQIDTSLDLRPLTIKTVLEQNPKITTHVGNRPPYGYVDWWPIALYVNCEVPPFNNPEIRWALSYFIDRKQLIDVAYAGAGTPSRLPMPTYPGLKPFFDAVEPLLKQYDTNEFNPSKGAALLQKNGWTKNQRGQWVKDGQPFKMEILGWTVFADIGPVLAEQFKRQGIDATYAMPPDTGDRFSKGQFQGMLNGHGGSVSGDPYFTLRLFQSKTLAVPGAHLVNFTRWKNEKFDQVVDEMATTPPEDKAKLLDQFKRAMEIWLPELPDIQLVEWYHRIPMNTTYWKNWPTEENPYVNGAFWHLTFPLILMNLEPAQ